jgi:hypothetical protein
MKRTNKNIVLGSGKAYLKEYSGDMPSRETICTDANLLGYIKGGATLSYTETTYEEKDDLGYVRKVITTDEEAKLKLGLITWNGSTLIKLADRGTTTESEGIRTTKLGGAGNAQGKNYVLCFHHEDQVDGDIWVMIVGRNTAGLSLAWSTGAGTNIEPEFTAIPHDSDGTLIEYIEQTAVTPTITMTQSTATVAVGSTINLAVEIAPAEAEEACGTTGVTWVTSNGKVTLGSSHTTECLVAGAEAGVATVTATIHYGGSTYSTSCSVLVTAT